MFFVEHLEKVWRPLGEGSLTVMTVMQDEPLRVSWSGADVCKRTLGKKLETLRKGVSDRHDGYAGRIMEGMS